MMWKDNKYFIDGKQVGEIWQREPEAEGYSTFPYGYMYHNSIGYLATNQQEAKRQVERHTN